MAEQTDKQKVIIIGAGPVGALAALYAAKRGDNVEVYELRGGMNFLFFLDPSLLVVPFFVVENCRLRIRRCLAITGTNFPRTKVNPCYNILLRSNQIICSKIAYICFVYTVL